MHRVNSRLMRMFIGPRWRCCRCGGVDDSQCLSQLTHSTTCYVSYYIRSSCTQSYQHNTHIVSLIITVQVLDLPLSIFFNDFLPMYRYIDTHTCRDTHACKRRHTVSEPSSLDLLTGLWLMWHILSPCSDAQRWATMVGIAHTHTSYMCTFFKHTRLTHAHTDTHTLNMDLVTYALQTSTMLAGPWMMSGRLLPSLTLFPLSSFFLLLSLSISRNLNLFSTQQKGNIKEHSYFQQKMPGGINGIWVWSAPMTQPLLARVLKLLPFFNTFLHVLRCVFQSSSHNARLSKSSVKGDFLTYVSFLQIKIRLL